MRITSVTPLSVALIAFTLGCGERSPAGPAQQPAVAPDVAGRLQAGPDTVGGRFIVRFKEGTPEPAALARSLVSAHRGHLRHAWNKGFIGFSGELSDSAVSSLKTHPSVLSVNPVVKLTTYVFQRYAGGSAQWGLDRIDHRILAARNYQYEYTQTGAGVRIYVVDTGVQPNTTEFGARVQSGYDLAGGNGQTDCANHGTWVASVAAGSVNGVASSAQIVPVRVTTDCGNGSGEVHVGNDDAIDGINWVIAHHVKPAVANISIGTTCTLWFFGCTDSDLDAAVRALITAGVTAVVAAGNDNTNACDRSPSRVTEAIVVGASTVTDQRLSSSNYGSCLDFYAPGDGIQVRNPDGGTSSRSGTSLAAPFATGVAALLLEARPTAPPSTVSNALVTGTSWISPGRLLYSFYTGLGMTGPMLIQNTGDYTWSVVDPNSGYSPWNLVWQMSEDGGPWTDVGTGFSYTRTVSVYYPSFSLRVMMYTAGDTAATGMDVAVCNPGGPCPP